MYDKKIEIVIVIISGTVILLSLAVLVIVFVVRHQQNIYKHKNQLLQLQLEIQEQTFNTISQEIHDNVGQILSVVNLQLGIIERNKSFDDVSLEDVQESVSKAIRDLRDIAKSLNTDNIRSSSLTEITGLELDRINKAGIIQATIQINGTQQDITEEKKLIVFRIIQEALHNILKHSKATKTEVIFTYNETDLKIIIQDNGIGFDRQLLTKKDGLGLNNILKRAELIRGNATIETSIGNGTTITIISPYT